MLTVTDITIHLQLMNRCSWKRVEFVCTEHVSILGDLKPWSLDHCRMLYYLSYLGQVFAMF